MIRRIVLVSTLLCSMNGHAEITTGGPLVPGVKDLDETTSMRSTGPYPPGFGDNKIIDPPARALTSAQSNGKPGIIDPPAVARQSVSGGPHRIIDPPARALTSAESKGKPGIIDPPSRASLSNPSKPGIIDPPRGIYRTQMSHCESSESVFCFYNADNVLVAVTYKAIHETLDMLQHAEVELTSEGVLFAAAGAAATATLVKYAQIGKSLNLIGALSLAVVGTAASAQGYCEMYKNPDALNALIHDDNKSDQLMILTSCPELTEAVFGLAGIVQEN